MILTAQIGAGIFFAINYDDVIEKGLTESLRGAKYTSLYSFWDELQKDVSTKLDVKRQVMESSMLISIYTFYS